MTSEYNKMDTQLNTVTDASTQSMSHAPVPVTTIIRQAKDIIKRINKGTTVLFEDIVKCGEALTTCREEHRKGNLKGRNGKRVTWAEWVGETFGISDQTSMNYRIVFTHQDKCRTMVTSFGDRFTFSDLYRYAKADPEKKNEIEERYKNPGTRKRREKKKKDAPPPGGTTGNGDDNGNGTGNSESAPVDVFDLPVQAIRAMKGVPLVSRIPVEIAERLENVAREGETFSSLLTICLEILEQRRRKEKAEELGKMIAAIAEQESKVEESEVESKDLDQVSATHNPEPNPESLPDKPKRKPRKPRPKPGIDEVPMG